MANRVHTVGPGPGGSTRYERFLAGRPRMQQWLDQQALQEAEKSLAADPQVSKKTEHFDMANTKAHEEARFAGQRDVPDYMQKPEPFDAIWEESDEHDMLTEFSSSFAQFKHAHRKLKKKITALGTEVTSYTRELAELLGTVDLPKDMDDIRIGLTHLRVPPERIQVDEISDLKHMSGLRSSSASVVNTGRAIVRISLDVVFPTDSDVFMKDASDEKNTLEYLITQFLTLPFTTISNKYIAMLVQQKLMSPKEKDEEDLDKDIAQKAQNLHGIGKSIAGTLVTLEHLFNIGGGIGGGGGLVTSNAEYAASLAKGLTLDFDTIQAASTNDILAALRRAYAILLNESRKQDDRKKNKQALDYGKRLNKEMERLRYALDEIRTLLNKRYDATKWDGNDYPPVVPVAFQSINFYPEPETTQTVRAQLEFVSLITTPYVDDYMWRDVLGRPTPYIEQCLIYEKLVKYRKQHMDAVPFEIPLKKLKDKSNKEAHLDNRELFSVFHYRNKIETATKADADFINDLPLHKRTEHFGPQLADRLDLSSGYHPVSFGITLTNRLAMQPVLGSVYGTVQYTGSRLGRFHLSVLTDQDKQLERIHRMDSDVKGLASYGIAEWRRTMLHIVNPYLKMAGMEFFELESISTSPVPGSTNVSKVDMRMTQYGAFPERHTKRFAGYRKLLDKASVKKGLEFLWEKFELLTRQLIGPSKAFKIKEQWPVGKTTPPYRTWNDPGYTGPSKAKDRASAATYRKQLVTERETVARILFGPVLVDRAVQAASPDSLLPESVSIIHAGYDVTKWGSLNKTQGLLSPFVLDCTYKASINDTHQLNATQWATTLVAMYDDAEWLTTSTTDLELDIPTLDDVAGYIADYADTKHYSRIRQKHTKTVSTDHGMYAPAQMSMKTLYNAASKNRVEGLRDVVGMEEADRPIAERILRNGALYPDLNLPPIHYALSEVLEVVTRKKAADSATKMPVEDLKSFEQLTDAQKLIIKRFLPKHADLGSVPEDGKIERIAPDPQDLISPDLPWAWVRMKNTILTGTENHPYYDRHAVHSNVNPTKILDTAGVQAEHKRFAAEGFKATPEVKDIIGINSDMLSTKEYHLNEVGDEGHKWEPGTPANIKKMVQYALLRDKDNHRALIRAFPTFKLMFIAENKKGWQVFDDVYSYNSVISINVTDHEYQTAIAEIVLTNLSGSLTMDGLNQEDGRLPSKRQTKKTVPQQVRDNKTVELTRFPLQQGTRIAIMLGYGSDIHGMETVFTGKVAEVSGTEMLHVVGQGYLMELTQPVGPNFKANDKAHDVVFSAMEAANPANFGRWHPSAWKGLNPTEVSNAKNLTIFGERYERVISKPYMRNVFVSNYTSYWTKKLVDWTVGESWDSGGGTATAWDLIQEIALYSPGYIARVVPYDLEATLFWGRPDQLYYHTDGRRRQEEKWLAQQPKHEKTTAPQNILDHFTHSPEYQALDAKTDDFWDTLEKTKGRAPVSYREYTDLYYVSRMGRTGMLIPPRQPRKWHKSGAQGLTPVHYSFADLPQIAKIQEDVSSLRKSKESEMRSIEGMLQADYVSGYVFGSFFDSLVYASEDAVLPGQAADVSIRVDWQQFGKLYKRGNLGSVFEGTLARSNIRKGLYPGTMLMNMPSWKAFLRRLAGPIGADVSVADMFRQHMQAYGGGVSAGTAFWQQQLSNPKNRTAMYAHVQAGNVPVAHTDEPWWRTAVGGINKEAWFISMMEAARPLFHAFLHFFDIWLKSNPFEWLSEAATFGAASEVSISPRMRPFREYHVAIDAWDIISNDISCSTGAMWNSVLITNGTSQPEIIDVSDHLKAADKIVRVFNEPNADLDIFNMASETNTGPVNNRVLVGNTRIAQGIRKMYRGQITLRGNPRIKATDILYIYDLKNMIWGPIEVERVTHTFNSNDGYTTTVKPKCYVEVNNYDGGLTSMVVNAFYDAAGLGLPLVAGIGTAAVGGFTPMGLAFGIGAWQSARKITDRSIAYLKRNKFSAAVAGAPSWAGQRTPVRIFPLSRMGSPWVAGLAGMLDSKDFTSYLWGEAKKDMSDAQDGATHLWDLFKEYIAGFESEEEGGSD